MKTRIGLLSDTHSYLDPKIKKHFSNCDEIWHAGDLGDIKLLSELQSWAKPIRGVYGNIDGAKIRAEWPEYQIFTVDDVKVLMLHIGGYPGRYNSRAQELIMMYDPNIVVTGHSHILKVMNDKHFHHLHINPGACGNIGWHKVRTIIRFSIDEGRAGDMEVIELGGRSASNLSNI